MPYGFEYDVNDGHNNFGHRQQSDGHGVTTGSYRVQLPDGRTQIVTYRADENGYNAKVTYEQTPTTPPPTLPAYYYNPATAYKAPLYRIAAPTTTTPTPFTAPFYEFPSIPPYGAAYTSSSYTTPAYGSTTPASTNNGEDSDEESADDSRLPLIPLLFRKNVEQISHEDSRIPYNRWGYSKRSPINLTSDAEAISKVVAPIEEVTPTTEVESQTDSITSGYEEVEFDHLPFPLPLPLAFRSTLN